MKAIKKILDLNDKLVNFLENIPFLGSFFRLYIAELEHSALELKKSFRELRESFRRSGRA